MAPARRVLALASAPLADLENHPSGWFFFAAPVYMSRAPIVA